MMTAYDIPPACDAERPENGTKKSQFPGMTLKDWFAGQVIAAMVGSDPSNSSQRDGNGQLCQMDPSKLANMAESAYQIAAAMMRVRSVA